MELEHAAHGIDFGSGFGQRLDWLDESVGGDAGAARRRGGDLGSRAATTRSTTCATSPLPVQAHLPIMIGGSGEKKTLRTVARYADMWNAMGPPDVDGAQGRGAPAATATTVGRDPSEIEFTLGIKADDPRLARPRPTASGRRRWSTTGRRCRDVADDDTFWNGTPDQLAEKLAPYVELGFRTVISEQPAPYDSETFERLIGEVAPKVAAITG